MPLPSTSSDIAVSADILSEVNRQKENKSLIVIGFFFGISAIFWFGVALTGLTAAIGAFWHDGIIFGLIVLAIFGLLLQPIIPFYVYIFSLRRFLEKEMKVLFVQDRPEYAALTAEVQELARRAGLAGVRYVGIQKGEMNAFAVGFHARNCAVVLGSTLVEKLDKDELRAVIGHEIGHIVSYDMAGSLMTMIVNATILQGILRPLVWVLQAVGWGGMFGGMFSSSSTSDGAMVRLAFFMLGLACFLLTFPLIAGGKIFDWLTLLLDRAHSRSREFRADRIGALLTSREAMASALRRLEDIPYVDLPRDPFLAFRFVSAMNGGERAGLFDTHPPLSARIQAIEAWQPGQP